MTPSSPTALRITLLRVFAIGFVHFVESVYVVCTSVTPNQVLVCDGIKRSLQTNVARSTLSRLRADAVGIGYSRVQRQTTGAWEREVQEGLDRLVEGRAASRVAPAIALTGA